MDRSSSSHSGIRSLHMVERRTSEEDPEADARQIVRSPEPKRKAPAEAEALPHLNPEAY
jgi:hypothetical protein